MGQAGAKDEAGRSSPLLHGPLTKADLRRERLIATARVLFAEHGFHATGMAQIAKRSGIAVGQIYRDFANKEEIVAAIVERDLGEFLDEAGLRRALADRDMAAVRGWIAGFVAGNDEGRGQLIAEILAESGRNERVAGIFRTIHDRLGSAIAEALAVLAPEPEKVQRRALLTEVILTVSSGLFHRRLAQDGVPDPLLVATLTRAIEREVDALMRDATPASLPPADG